MPHLLLVPGFASVGVVVAVRRRGDRIGWLFLGMGLAAALTGFSFAGLGFLLLLFPDGRLPSPRWRPVAWALAVCTAWLTTGTSN